MKSLTRFLLAVATAALPVLAQSPAQLKNELKECVRLGEETLRVVEAAKIESPDVNMTMVAMARCYSGLEQRDKAVAYLERVLPRAKRLEGYYSQQTASTLTELGREARAAGNRELELCIESSVRAWSFPQAIGNTVLSVPLSLDPRR